MLFSICNAPLYTSANTPIILRYHILLAIIKSRNLQKKGMKTAMKFEYGFYPYGTTKNPQDIPQNEIWVDIGGHLEGSMFDHHQETENETIHSAFSAVIRYIDRLQNIYNSQDIDTIRICTHIYPDMDALFCVYAVKYYFEHGPEAFLSLFASHEKTFTFEQYLDKIDQGTGKVVAAPTLYAITCSLEKDFIGSDKADESLWILNKGLKLIEAVINVYNHNKDLDLFTADLSQFSSIKQLFSYEIQYINECKTKYEQEERPNISIERIRMMNRKGKTVEVKAGIWKKKKIYDFSYLYVREEEHCDLTVIPYSIKGEGEDTVTRIIVSLRPDYEGDVSLLPLAEIFEQLEQIEEERIAKETGQYRRNYGRPRTELANDPLSIEPFCTTADPWYISKEEDLIDSPGICSILDYDILVDVIRNNAKLMKRSYYVSYKDSVNANTDNAISIDCIRATEVQSSSKWVKSMRNYLAKSQDEFSLIIAEISSSLVAHNNMILEAFCRNLIGKGFHDLVAVPFYYLDYKTCIYVGSSCAVILIASSSEADYKRRSISELLDLTNVVSVKSSRLIRCFMELVMQRKQLLALNKKIKCFSTLKRKEIENLNQELVKYVADTQANDIIENPTEQAIHDYAKASLRLDSLSESVISSLNVVISDSRDSFVHKFNILSAITIPFILISTFFQVGALNFVPIVEIQSKIVAAIIWVVILLFSVLTSVLLSRNWNSINKKKQKAKTNEKKSKTQKYN